MNTLMYDISTSVTNINQRQACVYFWPRTGDDKVYLKIQYSNSCTATGDSFWQLSITNHEFK